MSAMAPLGSVPYAADSGGMLTAISVDGVIPSSSLNGTLNRGTVPQVVAVAAVNLAGATARRSARALAGVLSFSGALASQKLRALIFATGALGFTATVRSAARKVLDGTLIPVSTLFRRRIRRALRFLGKAGIVSKG